MFDKENIIKVLHIRQVNGVEFAIVAVEQGHIVTGRIAGLKSERTGTTYRIDGRPLYLGDLEMMYNPIYSDILCDYYRSHKDYATSESMQKICETKHGFTYGPVLFADIKLVPCSGLLSKWEYNDHPEKFDVEVGDTLIAIDF